jgi:methylamine--corrinoid protein Co-methyltransferase
MISIVEFEKRSLTGPVMKENEFGLRFSHKLRELVAQYNINYNPDSIIPDDQTADNIYQAAVDLLVGVGLFNADTQRVIELTKEEIEDVAKRLREGPREHTMGTGQDRVLVKARAAGDKRPPLIAMSPAGVPSTEDLYVPYMQSFVQEEANKAVCWTCGLASYKGVEPKAGTPSEIHVGLGELELLREVGRRTGKAVDQWVILATTTSVGAVIAAIHAGGIKPKNTQIAIHLLPELKLDWSRLRLALYAEAAGIMPWTSGFAVMGMLARGPADGAVGGVASLLGQLAYGHGTFGMVGAMPIDGNLVTRPVMWTANAEARAVERHIGMPIGGYIQSKAGLCTEMALYEKAALVIVEVMFGAAWIWGCGCRNGVGLNVTAGLESRLVAETALAVSGLSREKCAELFYKIQAKFENDMDKAPPGKTFAECYDVQKVQPTAEYLAVYQKVKQELSRLGVPYR